MVSGQSLAKSANSVTFENGRLGCRFPPSVIQGERVDDKIYQPGWSRKTK
jgi:hypothetical protein